MKIHNLTSKIKEFAGKNDTITIVLHKREDPIRPFLIEKKLNCSVFTKTKTNIFKIKLELEKQFYHRKRKENLILRDVKDRIRSRQSFFF